MANQDIPEISVVIPVFNEEDNLQPLLEELEPILNNLQRTYEVLCINDCSTDSSLKVLQDLKQSRPWLRIVNHRINSGESAAQITGFRHARGELVITMDADQQNDPADIPSMLQLLGKDIAAVCGVRRKREDTIVKRISSRTANAFRNAITGDRIVDAGCTYRILRRSALVEVPAFNGMHRFLPTILRIQGYMAVEILVNDRRRIRGYSKYGVGNRIWRGIRDCFAMRWFRARCLRGDRIDGEC